MQLKSRNDQHKAVKVLGESYNAALAGTEGNLPLTESDLQTMTRGYYGSLSQN